MDAEGERGCTGSIHRGKDSPEARIGQALALLERESETVKSQGRSSEAPESSLRLTQAGDSPNPVGGDRRVVPAALPEQQGGGLKNESMSQ